MGRDLLSRFAMHRTVAKAFAFIAILMLILRTPVCRCAEIEVSTESHRSCRTNNSQGAHDDCHSRHDEQPGSAQHSHGCTAHRHQHHSSSADSRSHQKSADSHCGESGCDGHCPCPTSCACAPQSLQLAILSLSELDKVSVRDLLEWSGHAAPPLAATDAGSDADGRDIASSCSSLVAAACGRGNPCALLSRWLL